MAYLLTVTGKRVETAVNFLIKEGLRPDAILRLTRPDCNAIELHLDNTELMKLVSGLHADPRFTIDKRTSKRDKNMDSAVDDLLSSVRGK